MSGSDRMRPKSLKSHLRKEEIPSEPILIEIKDILTFPFTKKLRKKAALHIFLYIV